MSVMERGEQEAGACLLCGRSGEGVSLGRVDARYGLSRCPDCGFIYASPRPNQDELVAFYNEHGDYNSDPEPISPEAARRRTAHYAGLIAKGRPEARRILEIGGLHGEALYGLMQRGYEVEGADINQAAIGYAARHYGILIHEGETPPEDRAGSFDVLILSHVIEHILDPVAFLRNAGRFLAPGGMVLLEIPGVDTVLFDLFRQDYNMVRPPEHIDFFTRKTARLLLEKAGFTPLRTFTKTPVWSQKNVFLYGLMSLARKTGALQRLRSRKTAAPKYASAAPIPMAPGGLLARGLAAADYGTRAASVLSWPALALMDRMGKGLILFAIGRKQG